MNSGWIKLNRCHEASELIARCPSAFLLLSLIAIRARWKDCPVTRLRAGQAQIGDFRAAGLPTEGVYRQAKKVLLEMGFATFSGTSKGTIATITDSTIYDIFPEGDNDQNNGPTTNEQRANNGPTTTNKTDRKKEGKTDRQEEASPQELPFDSDDFAKEWEAWLKYRREIRKPLKIQSAKAQLAKLHSYGEAGAIVSIRRSIENGWIGLFDPPTPPAVSTHAEEASQIVGAYPRRERFTEAVALVAKQLSDGEPYEAMLAGTRAAAAVIRTLPSGASNRYVPSAEAFFRAKRWQDDPETLKRQGNSQTGQGQMDLEEAKKLLGGRAAYLDQTL